MGDGLAAALPDRHLVPGMGVAVDRLLDGAARPVGRAPDEGEVAAPERSGAAVVGELCGELGVGPVGLRHHHQPGGVLVEAVHDAGPPHAADAGKARRRNGRSARSPACRWRCRRRGGPPFPRGLSTTMICVILEHDIERDILRRGRRRLRRRQRDRDGIAGVDAMAGIADCAAADRHLAGQDQGLEPRARQVGDRYGERAVEPLAGIRLGDHDCFGAMINGHKYSQHERSAGGRRKTSRSGGGAHRLAGALDDGDLRAHHAARRRRRPWGGQLPPFALGWKRVRCRRHDRHAAERRAHRRRPRWRRTASRSRSTSTASSKSAPSTCAASSRPDGSVRDRALSFLNRRNCLEPPTAGCVKGNTINLPEPGRTPYPSSGPSHDRRRRADRLPIASSGPVASPLPPPAPSPSPASAAISGGWSCAAHCSS